MKPLAEIVAEIEATIKNKLDAYGDDANGVFIGHCLDEMARLCQAFRAAEKMRESCYADNSGGEYRRRCADCDTDIYSEHAADCSFAAWDRVTGGNDET